MSPRKIIQILYSLKLTLKNAVCDELMLSQLLRICVLIDIIQNILIENVDNPIHENMVAFFVRDFIYFFGNIINSDCTVKLKLAACKYFHKLCQQLLPSCAQHFQSHLNYIVSILMPIVKAKEPTKMSQTGMSLLSFLIVDQTVALKQAIGQLDSFPLENEFDQLREIQHKVKYNGNTFSLLDEINYFLLVDKRKIEGLLSLKEHVSIYCYEKFNTFAKSNLLNEHNHSFYSYQKRKMNYKTFIKLFTIHVDFPKIVKRVQFIVWFLR